MPLTPAGRLTLPLDNARKLFADSATFRVLMGSVATPALAYAKCWLWATDDDGTPEQASYPRAIFAHIPGSIMFRKQGTTNGTFEGSINVSIEIATPSEYTTSDQDAYTYINNKVGDICDEIFTLSHNGSEATLNTGKTHLNLTGYDIDQCGPLDLVLKNGTRLLGAEIVLHWLGQ